MEEEKSENGSNVQFGDEVSDDTLEELNGLQKLLGYDKGIEKLNDFAKWIFGATSILGITGAGIAISLEKMSFIQSIMIGSSMLFLTIALFLSALALTPVFLHYRDNSIESMQNQIEKKLIKGRGIKLKIAGFSFAFAILLSGLSPMITKFNYTIVKEKIKITSDVVSDTIFAYNVECISIAPGSMVELRLLGYKNKVGTELIKKSAFADEFGKYNVSSGYQFKKNNNDSILLNIKWVSINEVRHDSLTVLSKKPVVISPAKKGKK